MARGTQFDNVDFLGLSRILRTLTTPARRHRCEICRRVFSCHLCGISEPHPIHDEGSRLAEAERTVVLVCSDCIRTHKLFVVILGARVSPGKRPHNIGVNVNVKYYCHLTGELIGTGWPKHESRHAACRRRRRVA